MKVPALCALLALSPFFASAGMMSGEIGISLTILPSCKIDSALTGTSVTCANRTTTQPHISEMRLASVPGVSQDARLVTVEW